MSDAGETPQERRRSMRKSDLDETRIGDARPARMQGLATLPVFFKLKGKRAIVAGGNDPALWKAELLAAAGADVAVYADDFADGFVALASSPPAGSVMLHRRSWRAADLDGAAIAIAASPDEADARTFAAAARSAGVPVNIIDRPAFCDFQFGAVVNRSPLVVAISTDGGAPVFGQSIRSLIEGLLPSGFKRWAEAAKVWRGQGDRLGATPTARRRFWERFADMAMRNAERAPTDADLEHLIGGATSSNETAPPVTFIGVGESTETLTLGALKALRQADFIVFDAGVPSAVLDFARREAHRVPLSVEKSTAAIDEMIAAATCNRSVVCLYRTASAADRAIEQMATALGTAGTRAIILECAKHARK
jgi:uroporphyrin-III C-methyltransferase/precorrin-2 dehydrogenase/sirohydrochlorin ferrochelatase